MSKSKPEDFIGNSQKDIDEAFRDALHKAGEFKRVEVIETCGSHVNGNDRRYQVTLVKYKD